MSNSIARVRLRPLAPCAALVAALLAPLGAAALPIHYVHTGFGSGSLGGTPFGAAAPVAFTITATADTSTIESCGVSCLFNDNLTASISIGGVGNVDFITGTRFFANNGVGIVGFSRAGGGGADLYNGPALAVWDMASSVGPVNGLASLLQWGLEDVHTTGGILLFNDMSSDATFMATVVPEPGTWGLMALGLLGITAGARRRRTRSS